MNREEGRSRISIGLGFVLALACVFLIAEYASAQGIFTTIGSLATARFGHTATLLHDGKVLVAGGQDYYSNCRAAASAELYDPNDPNTGAWVPTGSMHTARYDFTATLLPNGKVLAAGGAVCRAGTNTAELYDPATRTWAYTTPMKDVHVTHAAVLLTTGPNAGKVLVVGGGDTSGHAIATAELYDPGTPPGTPTWTETGSLVVARYAPQAAVLLDGRVLVTGGQIPNVANLKSAELYDSQTGTWSLTQDMRDRRDGTHRMTLLPNGKVLVTGGESWSGTTPSVTLASAEIYDPATGTWSSANNMAGARSQHEATLLGDGKVLVTGGFCCSDVLSSAELYDPGTGAWSATGSMDQARMRHTALKLRDGRVLVAAGMNRVGEPFSSAELYTPPTPPAPVANAGPDQVVSAGPGCQVTVTLDGTGSSDPVGDSLTYTWTGPFGTASGPTPVVSLGLGEHTITLTVDDGKGGTSSDSVVVAVRDTTPPVLTAPGDITKEATGPLTPVTVPFPTVTDCSVVAVTSNAPALFPVGTTPVTFTATDAAGNTASVRSTVTVRDTTPPALTVPAAITKEAMAPLTPVALGTATAVDLVDGPVAVSNNAPTAGFPVGTTTVTWTAVDTRGNKATRGQVVTITDKTPPTATLSLTPAVLWPPNHRMVTITPTLAASDLTGPVTISGPMVTSNEAVDGLGDGDTSPDWIVTGTSGIQLRAERSGTGNGRTYTVTYVVTDQHGNSTTVSATVLVPKSQGK